MVTEYSFFLRPDNEEGDNRRPGPDDTLDINSIRARFAVQRLSELTAGIGGRKQPLPARPWHRIDVVIISTEKKPARIQRR